MPIQSQNPATEEILQKFEDLSPSEIDRKLALAATAFQEHRRLSFPERSRRMIKAAELLEAGKDRLARLMTEEMGKPIQAARDEVSKCALACRFYSENAEKFLSPHEVDLGDKARGLVRYDPIGPVLAVMPWNFPLWQVYRFAAPALMAGNVGLLKHASNVPRCALAIEENFREAGFAPGVFQTLLIGSKEVAGVIADPRIQAVTLTGSEAAGSEVAARAGKHLKKTVLELGGSDPFIVLGSADLEEAARTAVKSRTINSGQSCIAAKRFIAVSAIYDRFEKLFTERMSALRVGDPVDESVEVGPLATASIRDGVDEQVQRSVQLGAKLLLGGKKPTGKGYFYPPTVLADVPKSAPAFHDEVFGPVATLIRARDADDALAIANASTFGLGSSVWTRDEAEQSKFIRELEAGQVFVNAMVASDPRLPFGGVKRSGYGRELSSEGIREFVNTKSVWISKPQPSR